VAEEDGAEIGGDERYCAAQRFDAPGGGEEPAWDGGAGRGHDRGALAVGEVGGGNFKGVEGVVPFNFQLKPGASRAAESKSHLFLRIQAKLAIYARRHSMI